MTQSLAALAPFWRVLRTLSRPSNEPRVPPEQLRRATCAGIRSATGALPAECLCRSRVSSPRRQSRERNGPRLGGYVGANHPQTSAHCAVCIAARPVPPVRAECSGARLSPAARVCARRHYCALPWRCGLGCPWLRLALSALLSALAPCFAMDTLARTRRQRACAAAHTSPRASDSAAPFALLR